MNTDADELNQLTQQVIGCAFQVANTLGTGFLEKVYENALAHELAKASSRLESKDGSTWPLHTFGGYQEEEGRKILTQMNTDKKR